MTPKKNGKIPFQKGVVNDYSITLPITDPRPVTSENVCVLIFLGRP